MKLQQLTAVGLGCPGTRVENKKFPETLSVLVVWITRWSVLILQ